MYTINIWHKFNLYRREVVFLILFGCVALSGFGQMRQPNVNNPEYDNRLISYGFLIGLHNSGYQLKYADAFADIDTLHSIQPVKSFGFSLGFIVNLKMTEFLDLRLLPKVAFYEHRLDYIRTNSSPLSEVVESTIVELPLLVKYKSVRRGNFRMYLVGGGKYGIEASGKKGDQDNSDGGLFTRKHTFSIDAGVGLDIYYPLFKFSPEIRYSRGITNSINPNKPNEYSLPIKYLNVNTITLYLLFQ